MWYTPPELLKRSNEANLALRQRQRFGCVMGKGRQSSITDPPGNDGAQLYRLTDRVDELKDSFSTVHRNNNVKLSRLTEGVDEHNDYIYNIVFREIDKLNGKEDASGRFDGEANRNLLSRLTRRLDEHEEHMHVSVHKRLCEIDTQLHELSEEQKTLAVSLRHLKCRVDEHAEYM